MTITHILTPIAMQKQMIVGMMALRSSPATASTIARMAVMNKPETAVPTVYLETTSAERQLIMAYMTTSFILPPIPIMNEHANNRMKPSQVWSSAIEMISIPPRAKLTSMLPKMIRLTYLNLLLSQWKVSPMMIYPTKRGMGRKEYMLQPSNLQAKQSRAARTAFQPSRELMPLRVKIATVLVDYLDYFYILFIIYFERIHSKLEWKRKRKQVLAILQNRCSYGRQQLYRKSFIFKEICRLIYCQGKILHMDNLNGYKLVINHQQRFALLVEQQQKESNRCFLPDWSRMLSPQISALKIVRKNPNEKVVSHILYTSGANCRFLTNISVCSDNFGDASVPFLSAANWKFLKRICLSNNKIGRKGATQLGKCKWPYLISLDISFNRIRNGGLAGLVHGEWPRLTLLELEGTQLTGDGMRCLRRAWWPRLAILNLWSNQIASALINELPFCSLHALSNVLIGLGANETVNLSIFSKFAEEYRMTDFQFQPTLDVSLQKSVIANIANYFELMEEENV